MKRFFFSTILAVIILGCDTSDDADINYSGISPFLGNWTLQSKILNDIDVLPVEAEELVITDNNSLADYKGHYERVSNQSSNGSFSLNNRQATITFTSRNDIHTTYRFFILERTLQLFSEQNNGDMITENWVRVID